MESGLNLCSGKNADVILQIPKVKCSQDLLELPELIGGGLSLQKNFVGLTEICNLQKLQCNPGETGQ